jgi:murein L,D-transpeptidase YcbB/YkuD
MQSGNEQHVKLPESIPVHIVYFTAWTDEAGGLHFDPDIYKYDGLGDHQPGRVRSTTALARNARP